jgi:hypothetical protein
MAQLSRKSLEVPVFTATGKPSISALEGPKARTRSASSESALLIR